jgi:hypothetical protein
LPSPLMPLCIKILLLELWRSSFCHKLTSRILSLLILHFSGPQSFYPDLLWPWGLLYFPSFPVASHFWLFHRLILTR